MDLIKKRLAHSGFKVPPANQETRDLERILEETMDEDLHDPKRALAAKLRRNSVQKRRRTPTYTPSKGIKINDEAVFKKSQFTHPDVIRKKKEEARRLAALKNKRNSDPKHGSRPASPHHSPTRRQVNNKRTPSPTRPAPAAMTVGKAKSVSPPPSPASRDRRQSIPPDEFDLAHKKIKEERLKAQAMGSHERIGTHVYSSTNLEAPGRHPLKPDSLRSPSPAHDDHFISPHDQMFGQHHGHHHSMDHHDLEDEEHEHHEGHHSSGHHTEDLSGRSALSQVKMRTHLRYRKKGKKSGSKKVEASDSSEQLHSSRKVKYLARTTHFLEYEVASLIRIFRLLTQRNTKPGEMDRRHFRSYFQTTFGITDDILLDQLFHQFDEEHEGSIREHSWVKNLSAILRGPMNEQVDYCYDVYDLNGDGSLGREEVSAMLQGCIRGEANGDDDGIPVTDNDIVEMIIKKMDVTRLGYVTKKTFRDAVQKDPTLLQAFGETLPSSTKMTTFMALFTEDIHNFSTNYSWPGEQDFPAERQRYRSIFYKDNEGLNDPLRAQLAAINRQIYFMQTNKKNTVGTTISAMKQAGALSKRGNKSTHVGWFRQTQANANDTPVAIH